MNDFITSIIRTWVPIIVGAFVTWLANTTGVTDIDTATLATVVTGVVIAVYYALVRLAEARWPAIGFFLGKPTKPEYALAA